MCSFILGSGPSETGVSFLCLQSAAPMSWAPGDLKSFYQYSFNTSAVCSSRRLIGFCGIAAELWCWEPKQVENLNFLPVRFLHVLLFCEWSSGLQMCFCVRDRQRCSGPFSYITVEMAFFKAFPAFLSDGWMYPGSREHCCMCCFPCFLVNPATRYLHICVLSYQTCLCLFQLFLWASSVFYFIQSNICILYQPTLQVIPPPAWDSWFYWWRVSEMSLHVAFLLWDHLKPWALCCSLFGICFSCCWGDAI